jgi:conjugative relaxase-like TrwC/TraI family protein
MGRTLGSKRWAVSLMMTVHKLTAGDGYTYLTRQVASMDETRVPGQSLADYYTARGNPPGIWMGAGATTLGVAGGPVSEAQMRALFGEGAHPDRDALLAAGATDASTRLGTRYPTYQSLAPRVERVAAAARVFEVEHGRPPTTVEFQRLTLVEARRERRPVAGYDLVFTPVKSVSLLWALGGTDVRAEVEAAHHEAVASTIGWVERHAAFTRVGHGGTAQFDTTGLVAAAFDHRESRSGDPDLHTHVAVANKVCGTDGKWRSLDARGLHALGVAASERYNTRLEDALSRRLGVEFTERPGRDPSKRPVREVVGIPTGLVRHFSKRRAAIEDRYIELTSDYRHAHGREPDRSTQLRLAQQATLETREGKGVPRTMAELVTDWTHEASTVLGSRGIDRMLRSALDRSPTTRALTEAELKAYARQVVLTVCEQRSTWTRWNVYAETERTLRGHRFPTPQEREAATEAVVGHATGAGLSIRISEPELVVEPEALRRASDGQSVFVPHGTERYTTSRILAAEESLVEAAVTRGSAVAPLVAEAALAVHETTTGVVLDDGQRRLVDYFATYPALLSLGIGPAGAGKTTAMRALADVWAADGRRVVPLASSAKAAQVLGDQLELRAENLHKFLHEKRLDGSGKAGDVPTVNPWFRLATGDMVLVDEASMAGTLQLADLVALAENAGAVVRLLGDPAQLSAVEAGGALRLLEAEVGAVHLDQLRRFTNPVEAAATLALRRGNPTGLEFYETHDRIRAGTREAMLEAAYDAWTTDILTGHTSVLIAATTSDVTALNARARAERITAGQVDADPNKAVDLRDGNRASVGDWVVTRTNMRVPDLEPRPRLGQERRYLDHHRPPPRRLSVKRPGSGGGSDSARRLSRCLHRGSTTMRPVPGRFGCTRSGCEMVRSPSSRPAAGSGRCWTSTRPPCGIGSSVKRSTAASGPG